MRRTLLCSFVRELVRIERKVAHPESPTMSVAASQALYFYVFVLPTTANMIAIIVM